MIYGIILHGILSDVLFHKTRMVAG
uniref:Uncharacterized protein n=1 Tax=Arundo donax TaxID=35708 RepID=A0A0A8Z9J1_ARUDO